MRTTTFRRSWLRIVAALVVLLAVGLWIWATENREPAQIITLPDGTQYRFAGVTYGTNNVPPYWLARLIRHVPAGVSNFISKRATDRLSQMNLGETYPEPRLILWFERMTTNTVAAANPNIPSAVLVGDSGMRGGAMAYAIIGNFANWSFV